MELQEYRSILLRRKWVILLTLALTMAIAVAGTMLTTPVYASVATVRVTVTSGSIDYVIRDSTYTDRLINTYISLAKSHAVTDAVAQQLRLAEPPNLTVTGPANSELIRISAEDRDPRVAAQVANGVANNLVAHSQTQPSAAQASQRELQAGLAQAEEALRQARLKYESLAANPSTSPADLSAARADLDLKQTSYTTLLDQYDSAQVTAASRAATVTLVDPAVPPRTPAKPNRVLNLGIGLVVGLVGAAGLAFLLENLDDRLHTTRAIRTATGVPVLGRIPATRRWHGLLRDGGSVKALESFRWLRTNLLALQRRTPFQTVLVTSSDRAEGRSTVIANLAVVLASAGRKVALVDADLREPALHHIFNLPNGTGLSSVLQALVPAAAAMQETEYPGVKVLTSGPGLSNPPDLLGSERMRTLLRQLATRFDLVLLDAPALRQVADAAILAGMVDGVLLVVLRRRARRGAVRAALAELATVQARVLGVVVNQAEPHDDDDVNPSEYPRPTARSELAPRDSLEPIAGVNGRLQLPETRVAGDASEAAPQ